MTQTIAVVICRIEELSDPSSKEFSLGSGDWPLRGFVVRKGEHVCAYLNRCPHAGHPLNLRASEFLDRDQRYIMCRSHGALFEIASGECVAGPCAGQSLRAFSTSVREGEVILEMDLQLLAQLP